MSITFIPTTARQENGAIAASIVKTIRDGGVYPVNASVILYTGWPNVRDYNGQTHSSDLTAFGDNYGVKLVKFSLSADINDVKLASKSILQTAATTDSLMSKSLILKKRRKLIFDVIPIIYAPNVHRHEFGDDTEIEIAQNEGDLFRLLGTQDQSLDFEQRNEVQAIIEGAKALGQIGFPDANNNGQPIGRAFRKLEAIIYNFDSTQRAVALTAIKGPQRIRGLAGTGKTVILAMKAALAHIENPNAKILVTYYTRSLRDVMERLITRFHRHFAEVDPNWDNVHVRHGWGRTNVPGVYRDTCNREGVPFKDFGEVKNTKEPFAVVCRELINARALTAYYDVVLVDEGQDFPDSFYQMCYHLTKGVRDQKQIIWAYDELQNVFDVTVREPEQLFGLGTDRKPLVSLARSLPQGIDTNDFVLQRAYRNQRDVLVLAHSVGFGVYRKPVQMLENAKHWEDVGYDVISGEFTNGSRNVVERPLVNSPSALETPEGISLIEILSLPDWQSQMERAIGDVELFLAGGLLAHEILVVSLDDRMARSQFAALAHELASLSIPCNNIINDPYTEPPFRIDGKITLSTVYRAKGNEAALVIVLGADAAVLETRIGRNKLFVAFTRTKGWLRIYGLQSRTFSNLEAEVHTALQATPQISFTMPDMNKLNTIQRGLEDKHARIIEAKRRMERMKTELELSDQEISQLFLEG